MNLQANEVAEKLGVEPSAVSNWTGGVNMAKGKNLRELGKVLEVDPNWLLGTMGDDETPVSFREDPPKYQTREPSNPEAAGWKERALTAEKKLQHVSSVLASLMELAKPHEEKAQPEPARIIPGTNSAVVSDAARKLAAIAAEKVMKASLPKREADEPSEKTHPPKHGVEKD